MPRHSRVVEHASQEAGLSKKRVIDITLQAPLCEYGEVSP